jgi:hypothetical protein
MHSPKGLVGVHYPGARLCALAHCRAQTRRHTSRPANLSHDRNLHPQMDYSINIKRIQKEDETALACREGQRPLTMKVPPGAALTW